MANNNNGGVNVRFSVSDEQVVRKALEALGKDGEAALKRIDAAARTPGTGLKALSAAMGELRDRLTDSSTTLGAFGNVLRATGPIGLTVAAVLGTLFLAFEKVKEGAKAFNQFSRELKDAAETAGVSIPVYQAVLDLAQRHGVAAEKAASGLAKFAEQSAAAARGQGDLYTALKRIDSGLAEEFAGATNQVQRLEIFIKALQRTSDTATQAELGKAAFGRGSGGLREALVEASNTGGLDAVIGKLKQLGLVFDSEFIEKQAKAAAESERKAKIWENNWDASFAILYSKWKGFWNGLFGSDTAQTIAVNFRRAIEAQFDPAIKTLEDRLRYIKTGLKPGETEPLRITVTKGLKSPEQIRADAERDLKNSQDRLAILGDMASAEERVAVKRKELALSLANVSKAEKANVLELTALQISQAEQALRSKFALNTEDQKRIDFEREFSLLVARGIVQENERTEARRVFNRELRNATDAEAVRRSDFPQLKQLSVDADRLDKTFDQLAAGGINTASSAMADMEMGTVKLGEGFKNLATSVGRSVLEMVNKMLLARTVGAGLQSLFNSLGIGGGTGTGDATGGMQGVFDAQAASTRSAFGNAFSGGRLSAFAGGGVITRPIMFPMANGAGLAGEAGPEAIMPLKRLAGGRLGVSTDGAGGGSPVVNLYNLPAAFGRPDVKQGRDDRGRPRLDIFFDRAITAAINSPGSDSQTALRQGGLAPSMARR